MSTMRHAPPEPTSFVGRADELAAITAATRAGRVLTLVAVGGAGKTRLAARAAADLAPLWRYGAWWVDLASCAADDDVVVAVADALDVTVSPADPIGSLAHDLALRALLLVLDNCEQVAAGVAALVDAITTTAPGVGVLATSRMPLGAATEQVWRVPAMVLAEAMELFVDRARSRGAEVDGTAGARRICDRLDRLPLALELAAGWAGALTTDQIAESMAEPLELLDDGPRAAPYRLRTLEGSVQWSHDLLDETERVVFRRLAALQAGFTAEQAIEVCTEGLGPTDVMRALRRLVESSLLAADTTGQAARYSMLEVIHAFARARLAESGEEAATRDRHLAAFLETVRDLEPLLETDKDTWRDRVRAEHANFVAAVEWGLKRPDTTQARLLVAGLAWLWHFESRGQEGLRLLTMAVERGGDEQSVAQARVLVGLALVADIAQPGAEGYRHATTGLAMARAVGDAATARLAASLTAIGAIGEDLDLALGLAAEARAEGLAAGDAFVADGNAVLIGILHHLRDDHRAAERLLEPSARALLARGDRGVAATALSHLALTFAWTGRLPEAATCAERAVEAAEPLHDLHRVGLATAVLADVRALQGRIDDALAAVTPIQSLLDGIGQVAFVPGWQRTMARLALHRGRPDEAVKWCRREVRWLGETAADDQLTTETQVVLASALRQCGDTAAAISALDAAERAATAMGLARVTAGIAEERGRRSAEARDIEAANDHHHAALALRAEHALVIGCVDSLEALASLGVLRGTTELAVVLQAAADEVRSTTGYAARPTPEDPAVRSLMADPVLASAVEQGHALGLDAAAYARRMRGRRDRPDHGWASLTPTELSVVELAVEGLSNPQIAERLYIGRGTVKTHLAHVYAKLGVANRTELTAEHARRG